MRKLFGKITSIIFTVLLWYLQEIPENSQNKCDVFLLKHKILIAWIALGLIIVLILFDYIINIKNRKKAISRWTHSFLEHIVKEHLDGGNFQTRITIFCPCKGYKMLFSYLFVYPIRAFLHRYYKIGARAYWRNVPYKLFDSYLKIYARYGYSTKVSYTHFLLTEEGESYNGVADKCFRERVEQTVCTKSISSQPLPSKYSDANKSVKKYMRESYIGDKYYSTLLAMNTKANNLYAVPIFNVDQRIWGVMVIDNDSQEVISYKEKLAIYIAMYQKIFSYTLQILK